MDGSAFRGIGDAILGLVHFAIFCFFTLITTLILLVLSLTTVWSYWYLLLFGVSTLISWIINRRIQ